jgi:hypothetical protein
MKAGCRTTSAIVARGCNRTPVTRRMKISFAHKYDDGPALVSLIGLQIAEYDRLFVSNAFAVSVILFNQK